MIVVKIMKLAASCNKKGFWNVVTGEVEKRKLTAIVVSKTTTSTSIFVHDCNVSALYSQRKLIPTFRNKSTSNIIYLYFYSHCIVQDSFLKYTLCFFFFWYLGLG